MKSINPIKLQILLTILFLTFLNVNSIPQYSKYLFEENPLRQKILNSNLESQKSFSIPSPQNFQHYNGVIKEYNFTPYCLYPQMDIYVQFGRLMEFILVLP
jgi:hypothetical protein